ncbi:MAG: alpha/beta hydrolase [Pseudonocardiales bacterium]|nr:MAG: alpha/beta hydrolase [Pseudonocardiales bacterium]
MSVPAAVPTTVAANGWAFTGFECGPPDGRTVLLLHGFPQTAASWAPVAARLAEVGLRAVALDQRGYSPDARPLDVADYALVHLVADAVGMIEALGGSVDLVGHDWGGVVGWQVAARHPGLVRTWTAVSTPNPLALNDVLATDEQQRARFSYIRDFRQPGRAEAALLADDAAALRAFYGSAVAPERIDADTAFFAQPGVLTAALNWYRAMSLHDTDGLARVNVATSYVWGSADMAFGRAAAERSAAYVDAPYSFVALESAGHWLPDEAADTLAEEIAHRVLPE